MSTYNKISWRQRDTIKKLNVKIKNVVKKSKKSTHFIRCVRMLSKIFLLKLYVYLNIVNGIVFSQPYKLSQHNNLRYNNKTLPSYHHNINIFFLYNNYKKYINEVNRIVYNKTTLKEPTSSNTLVPCPIDNKIIYKLISIKNKNLSIYII